ncbi:unnamed protein product [Urochloa decumbens]|uniref:Uncharacterized protein n=1 Tax=Urochloa decumbens TaxID=240449 RepID=A0ABC9FFY1_9POAL
MEPLNRANELPESTRAFYFVKIWPFEDPELRENIVEAEYAFQKKVQTRDKIVEAVRAKKEERSIIISELNTLVAENKQCHIVVGALRNHLGKFRGGNNTMQSQGTVFVEELEQMIKMLSDRIVYEHISIAEEKRLVKEISDIKKVIIYLSTNRALQDTLGGNEATHDKVKIIDGIRKEQQAIGTKTKVLEDELNVVNAEIASIIQEDLVEATTRKYMAYEILKELRSKRDVKNELFIENRAMLNRARDYASRGMVTQLQGLHKTQVDKFMAQWCQSKDFREDYKARTLSSLNFRKLGQRWPDDDY